jgi:hypothetical protein
MFYPEHQNASYEHTERCNLFTNMAINTLNLGFNLANRNAIISNFTQVKKLSLSGLQLEMALTESKSRSGASLRPSLSYKNVCRGLLRKSYLSVN